MLRAEFLAGLAHGFSTREELDLEAILPGAPMVLAKQVHSVDVATVVGPSEGEPPEADALVTDRPGLLIGIVTADCGPVLLADRDAGVIGAVHAGWRGAVGGVLENAIAAMEALGARREGITAAIGPTIAQASYEVDAALRDCFPYEAHRFFAPGAPGHWQFDLPGFVAQRLREAGVGAVEDLAQDTHALEQRFFSFRRATQRGEPTGGRQMSVIALQALDRAPLSPDQVLRRALAWTRPTLAKSRLATRGRAARGRRNRPFPRAPSVCGRGGGVSPYPAYNREFASPA